MTLRNSDLRQEAKAAGVFLYQIANAMGVSEPTITRKLRFELSEHEKQHILSIIKSLSEENHHATAKKGNH